MDLNYKEPIYFTFIYSYIFIYLFTDLLIYLFILYLLYRMIIKALLCLSSYDIIPQQIFWPSIKRCFAIPLTNEIKGMKSSSRNRLWISFQFALEPCIEHCYNILSLIFDGRVILPMIFIAWTREIKHSIIFLCWLSSLLNRHLNIFIVY